MEVLGGEYRCVGVEAEVLGEIQGQRVRLEDCDLHSGRGRGLQVMGERTTVVAVGCRMRNNRAAGVSVRYGGQAELIGCELTGNGNHGEFKAVMIHDPGSKLVLQGCTVAGEGVEPPRAEGGAELTIKAADGRVLLYEKAPYVTDKKYEKSMYGVLL